MNKTSIAWTDVTWNPTRGCTIVSPGCANCYAMRQAHRFSGEGMPYEGLTRMTPTGPKWTGQIRLVERALFHPHDWKKPRRVFVDSMSDLFHEGVPDEFIDRVFAVMAQAHWHTYIVLTKRTDRARRYLSTPLRIEDIYTEWYGTSGQPREAQGWLLPNVWLLASVENQETADERIPDLLQTPAAVRGVSAEPLLEPTDLGCAGPNASLDWVIVGGESGAQARPCDVAWIRSIREQCQAAGVAVFVKQLGARPFVRDLTHWRCAVRDVADGSGYWLSLRDRKGEDPSEWPEDLRIREWPG